MFVVKVNGAVVRRTSSAAAAERMARSIAGAVWSVA